MEEKSRRSPLFDCISILVYYQITCRRGTKSKQTAPFTNEGCRCSCCFFIIWIYVEIYPAVAPIFQLVRCQLLRDKQFLGILGKKQEDKSTTFSACWNIEKMRSSEQKWFSVLAPIKRENDSMRKSGVEIEIVTWPAVSEPHVIKLRRKDWGHILECWMVRFFTCFSDTESRLSKMFFLFNLPITNRSTMHERDERFISALLSTVYKPLPTALNLVTPSSVWFLPFKSMSSYYPILSKSHLFKSFSSLRLDSMEQSETVSLLPSFLNRSCLFVTSTFAKNCSVRLHVCWSSLLFSSDSFFQISLFKIWPCLFYYSTHLY